MHKLILGLLFTLTTCRINAQTMPILRVNFQGKFAKEMDYISGTMQLTDEQGAIVELPAKFKTRGATALDYSMKPSFNMKLRTIDNIEIDSSLLNIRSASSWILDAMAIDRIDMRNRICFDIWNAFSRLPYQTNFDSRNGTLGKFVEVYINNDYKGIYCLSDRINRKLLNLKKPNINGDTITIRGVLYKHGTTSILDQSQAGFFLDSTICVIRANDAWELKEPEDYGGMAAWQPLLDYYDNINSYSYINDHFYISNLVDYTIFVMALAIADNWGNKNKFFSIRNIQADGNKSRFIVTPWDLDTSFGGSYNGSYYNGNYEIWPVSSIINNAPPPFSTCLQQSSFVDSLKARWLYLCEGALSIDSVAHHLYKYAQLFIGSGAWQRQADEFDAQKYRPQYVDDLYSEITQIVEWYQTRFQEVDAYFGVEPTAVKPYESAISTEATKYYNLNGNIVNKDYKGVIIHNRKKVIRR